MNVRRTEKARQSADWGNTMGATNFEHECDAYDAKEAFRTISDSARREYGEDCYNGTISTCSFGRVTAKTYGKTGKVTPTSMKKAHDFIERHDWGHKWYCDAVDCGVKEWHVITLKKVPHTKATVQFRTVFTIMVDGIPYGLSPAGVVDYAYYASLTATQASERGDFKTQAEANKELKRLIAHGKLNDAHEVEIVKRAIPTSGKASNVAIRYVRDTRVLKNKPKSVPDGAIVKELHTYVLYGWASC